MYAELMRLLWILLSLAAAPSDREVVKTWPDGGPQNVRNWASTDAGRVLVSETSFFTTGERWSEFTWAGDGGQSRTWSTEGFLADETPINRDRLAQGLSRKYQRDGGLVALGSFSNGEEIGEWKTWYENGQLSAVQVFKPAGVLAYETTWTEDGWKQTQRTPALREEFGPDGGLVHRVTSDGRYEAFSEGRLLEQHRTTKTGDVVLVNSWATDGGLEIRNGVGSRIEYDGELGTPHRVYYRGGKRVSPR